MASKISQEGTTTNALAIASFVARRNDALDALKKLTAHVEDHMGVDPETLHWGHVGDAGHLAEALAAIVRATPLDTNRAVLGR